MPPPINDFKALAIGVGAAVQPQAAWAADTTFLANGFPSGIVAKTKFNKAIRQPSVIAAAVAQFIANTLNEDVLDDGDFDALVDQMTAAFGGGGGGGSGYGKSVFDYLSPAEIADVQSGVAPTIDLVTKINLAITAVKAVGGILVFPRGQYLVSAPLIIDYSTDTLDPTQDNTNRISFLGEGDGATQLVASHAGALIDYRGGVTGTAGVHSFFHVEKMSLCNSTPRQAGSIAVKMDNVSLWGFQDVSILGFEYGVKATDILSGYWLGGRLWSCTYGFRAEYANFSRPNALAFRSVAIAGHRRYGVYAIGPALLSFDGGSIEGNGIDSIGLPDGDAMRSNCWGVKLDDAGVEGVIGLAMKGGYIEGNSGKADIWISQLANACAHSMNGTSFLRFSATAYVLSNILYDSNPTTDKDRISIQGCAFRSQSPYTAVNTRPYIGSQVAKIFDGGGNYYDNETELDRAVFAPTPLPRIPTASYPGTVAPYTGGLFWHPTLKRVMVGGDSKFQFAVDGPFENYTTDGSPSIVYMTNQPVFVWNATMTAIRNVTLSTSNAYPGARWTIHRLSSSPYALNIYSGGPIKAVLYNPGDWAEFMYDGTAWLLFRSGVAVSGNAPAKSLVQATRGTTQDIGQNVDTTIIFDTEEFDTLGEYNAASGVFTAKYARYLRISATASTNAFNWVAGTQFFLRLMKNGVAIAASDRDYKIATGTAQASAVLTTLVKVAVGDTLAIAGRTDRTPDADANNISASAISNHLSIESVEQAA